MFKHKSYQSDLDKLLQERQKLKLSESQQYEVERHKEIFNSRDQEL